MASYTIFIQNPWTEPLDKLLSDIGRVDELLNQVADDAVFHILARHYDASGIKQGGVFGGRHYNLLKLAITKRGAYGNITKIEGIRLTVGVSYEQIYYARWALEGRGPVRAKPGKFLRWINPDTGKIMFAKSVGSAPAHPIYFLDAGELREIGSKLTQLIDARIK